MADILNSCFKHLVEMPLDQVIFVEDRLLPSFGIMFSTPYCSLDLLGFIRYSQQLTVLCGMQ